MATSNNLVSGGVNALFDPTGKVVGFVDAKGNEQLLTPASVPATKAGGGGSVIIDDAAQTTTVISTTSSTAVPCVTIDPTLSSAPITRVVQANNTPVRVRGRGPLGYFRSDDPTITATISGIDFPANEAAIAMVLLRVREADLVGNVNSITVLRSSATPRTGFGVNGGNNATAVNQRSPNFVWPLQGGASTAASTFQNTKGDSRMFGTPAAPTNGDTWVWSIMRKTSNTAFPVTEQFFSNQFAQPANSLFIYWCLPGDSTSTEFGSLSAGFGNLQDFGADGPLEISGAANRGAVNSLAVPLVCGSVVRTDAQNTVIDLAAFRYLRGRDYTAQQIASIADGYDLEDLGLTPNANDVWIDCNGLTGMKNKYNAAIGPVTFTGTPKFFEDGPVLMQQLGKTTDTSSVTVLNTGTKLKAIL